VWGVSYLHLTPVLSLYKALERTVGDAHPGQYRDILFGSLVSVISTNEQATLLKVWTPTSPWLHLQLLTLSGSEGEFTEDTGQGELFSTVAVCCLVDKKTPS
jgi:hypothetical protein